MRGFSAALVASMLILPSVALASEAGDRLPELLYSGGAVAERPYYEQMCNEYHTDACFGLGLIDLIATYERLAQSLYRHGVVAPSSPAAALIIGIDADLAPDTPANPDPEPLTYQGLRLILEDFVAGLDMARNAFNGGSSGSYVVMIDPLLVRVDLDGDGEAGADETLAVLLRNLQNFDAPASTGKTKTKGAPVAPDMTVGFDSADSIWFAGYSHVTAIPVDLLLAHDFNAFFDAILHRVFPQAGLAMEDYARGPETFLMDRDSDTFFADMIAAVHTAKFPVTDSDRLAGVLQRMKDVTALSRKNWEAILAETDDNRELVPSPSQTSIFPGYEVTGEIVDAWMTTLDTVDRILEGELLIPHWRFEKGLSLKAYFETATETDIVMLFTGQGALPFLSDGPIADEDSFAAGNEVFGNNWPNFIVWFN